MNDVMAYLSDGWWCRLTKQCLHRTQMCDGSRACNARSEIEANCEATLCPAELGKTAKMCIIQIDHKIKIDSLSATDILSLMTLMSHIGFMRCGSSQQCVMTSDLCNFPTSGVHACANEFTLTDVSVCKSTLSH